MDDGDSDNCTADGEPVEGRNVVLDGHSVEKLRSALEKLING